MDSKLLMDDRRHRMCNSKKIALVAFIFATILLVSCPPPTPDPTPTPPAPPAPTAPAAPGGLTATATETTITLSWNEVARAASYHIYRADADADAIRIATDSDITGSSYIDNNVIIGTNYTYTVRAVDSTGLESPHSDPETVTLLVIAPAAPVLVSTAGGGTVMLSWNRVERANHYLIYRDGSDTPLVTTPDPYTDTTYEDSGLTNGTPYTYTVQAVGSTGLVSPHSNPVSATPDTPPAAPTVMSTMTATGDTVTVMLSWDPVDEATSYRIYRAVGDADAMLLVTEPTVYTATTYTDSTVVRGTAYSYTVRAVKGDSESLPSNSVLINQPTLPPGNLNVTPGDGEVELSWDAVAGAVNYHITVGTAGTEVATIPPPPEATTITHRVTGLTNTVEYNYTVRSAGSNEVLSDASTIRTYPIAAPGNLRATLSEGEVKLSWNQVPGATAYRTYRGNEDQGTVAPGSATSTYDDEFISGRTYTYSVHAVNMAGQEGPSSVLTFTPTE